MCVILKHHTNILNTSTVQDKTYKKLIVAGWVLLPVRELKLIHHIASSDLWMYIVHLVLHS